MNYTTGEWTITPEAMLTVRSSVWRYLESEMNPEQEHVVVSCTGDGWIAGVLSREFSQGLKTAKEVPLDRYSLLVLQPDKLAQLNGHTLQYEDGLLSVC